MGAFGRNWNTTTLIVFLLIQLSGKRDSLSHTFVVLSSKTTRLWMTTHWRHRQAGHIVPSTNWTGISPSFNPGHWNLGCRGFKQKNFFKQKPEIEKSYRLKKKCLCLKPLHPRFQSPRLNDGEMPVQFVLETMWTRNLKCFTSRLTLGKMTGKLSSSKNPQSQPNLKRLH